MDKKKIRDIIRLISSLSLFWLYIPHLIILLFNRGGVLQTDIKMIKKQINIKLSSFVACLYLLHNNSYFRTLFYYRIGPIKALLISWWRPGDKYFNISYQTKIGKGFNFFHPYSTVINAESIGDNFHCLHCTTIGAKGSGRPIIGNNVSCGATVTIIGGIRIGNNVTIGAGSVVVKDIPDNCIIVGNPAKVIRNIP